MAKITPDEALQRLSSASTKRKSKGNPMEFVRTIGNMDDAIYIFRQGSAAAITTSDSELKPLVGYCEDADFTQDVPPCLDDWLHDYAAEVEWYQRESPESSDNSDGTGKRRAAAITPNNAKRMSVPALVDSKWGQKTPYNDKLIFNGQRCMTGCSATAAAQIIRYWANKGLKRGCMAVDGYTTKSNHYKIEPLKPITVFDFANMTAGKPKTDVQRAAVATLMQYAGEAIGADYAPGGTGGYATTLAKRLKSHFRMGQVRMIYASSGAAAFEEAINNELMAGRPVLMAGGGTAGRHAFVCDGYNAESDLYNFNWGWEGKYNGEFAMTSLNPWVYTFNNNKTAIIGIMPEYVLGDANRDGKISLADVNRMTDDILNNRYEEAADVDSDGEVSLIDITLTVDKISGKE